MRTPVRLSRSPTASGDSDGYWEPLVPERVWAAVDPIGNVDRVMTSLVTLRYHPQVTMDTRIVIGPMDADRHLLPGARELIVKGFQNVEDLGVELRLTCEEVIS